MPNNRGSRIAASRARAQAKAHKKAHSTGPVIAAAAHIAPVADDEGMDDETQSAVATEQADDTANAEAAPAPAKTATAVRRSNVSRTVARQRDAVISMQSFNLKREVATIGVITAIVGITLAVLKLATDIGA